MKVSWTAKDVKAYGGKRIRSTISAPNEEWIIGWSEESGGQRWCKVSLADGMIAKFDGPEQLAKNLTEYEYWTSDMLALLVRGDDEPL